jgi:hypothetical protein
MDIPPAKTKINLRMTKKWRARGKIPPNIADFNPKNTPINSALAKIIAFCMSYNYLMGRLMYGL